MTNCIISLSADEHNASQRKTRSLKITVDKCGRLMLQQKALNAQQEIQ
jgi:hypothetical protein